MEQLSSATSRSGDVSEVLVCYSRPKYSEGVIQCQSGPGEWFRASQRGVKSLKNQLYGFVPLSCVEEVMGPNSVQQHGMLSLCLIGKSTACEHVALHNSFAILGPTMAMRTCKIIGFLKLKAAL